MTCHQLQKGASSARSDDTKSLKGVIIDWIAPSDGEPLRPPLARNVKADRGFNHERTGYLLCPAGMDWADAEWATKPYNMSWQLMDVLYRVKRQLKNKELIVPGNHWPLFVYRNEEYDSEEPWKGLFRSKLLVSVCAMVFLSATI